MLKIYNTLNKKKQIFKPIVANKVSIYVCGMTVYDYCHIGHARVMVVFDMIVRQLRRHFSQVNYVRNITDIDDKIINQAIKNKEDISTLTTRFIEAMHTDEAALLNIKPDIEPRATKHLPQMLAMIQKLLDNGLAYQADNGDIYYAVRHFKNYGKLSHKNLNDLQSGARVEVGEDKKDPLDFVLWKANKANNTPHWQSPFGSGRPGWHLECSAMACHYLSEQFDIHGGGADLVFPHHENEIAQAEGVYNKKFVNVWMHVGFVNTDDTKMSKSLGNFTTIREALKQYNGEVLRYFILSSHYRSPLNYSNDNLNSAKTALTRLYTALNTVNLSNQSAFNTSKVDIKYQFSSRFFNALDDDFNTPIALTVLFEISRNINILKTKSSNIAISLAILLKNLGAHLGILSNDNFFTANTELSAEEIEEKINERNQARTEQNFVYADKIRTELARVGIILEDNKNGTSWRKK